MVEHAQSGDPVKIESRKIRTHVRRFKVRYIAALATPFIIWFATQAVDLVRDFVGAVKHGVEAHLAETRALSDKVERMDGTVGEMANDLHAIRDILYKRGLR